MSYLREIMQRLNARSTDTDAPATAHQTETLEDHLADYRDQLKRCNDAMLQYECAWLEQHIETLELCGSNPEMRATAGGTARVQNLLEESRRFQQLLDQHMVDLDLKPSRHHATVVATEHAWELTHPGLRRDWGIDPEASGPGQ